MRPPWYHDLTFDWYCRVGLPLFPKILLALALLGPLWRGDSTMKTKTFLDLPKTYFYIAWRLPTKEEICNQFKQTAPRLWIPVVKDHQWGILTISIRRMRRLGLITKTWLELIVYLPDVLTIRHKERKIDKLAPASSDVFTNAVVGIVAVHTQHQSSRSWLNRA